MKKILFPTDFSSTAENAFIYALKLANKLGASITTIHTYDMPLAAISTSPPVYTSIANATQHTEFAKYQKQAHQMRTIAEKNGFGNVQINHNLTQGFTVEEILTYSNDNNMDLIVMGTEGAKGLMGFLWGSRSTSVLAKAPCPILIIPKNTANKKISKIAYATNFDEPYKQNIEDVLGFAFAFDAELKLLHIALLEESWDKRKIEHLQHLTKISNNLQGVALDIVDGQNVIAEINEYIQTNAIDMLVMFKHDKPFLDRLFTQSSTEAISNQAKIPLLVFNE